jgi:hypothetical protein
MFGSFFSSRQPSGYSSSVVEFEQRQPIVADPATFTLTEQSPRTCLDDRRPWHISTLLTASSVLGQLPLVETKACCRGQREFDSARLTLTPKVRPQLVVDLDDKIDNPFQLTKGSAISPTTHNSPCRTSTVRVSVTRLESVDVHQDGVVALVFDNLDIRPPYRRTRSRTTHPHPECPTIRDAVRDTGLDLVDVSQPTCDVRTRSRSRS